MSNSRRFSLRPLAALAFGAALLLAACGGSGDSAGGNRNRNAALLPADCYSTQQDKDTDVAKKQSNFDHAKEAEDDLADRQKAYDDAEREYRKSLNDSENPDQSQVNLQDAAFHKAPEIPRTTTTTSTTTSTTVPRSTTTVATSTTVKTNGSGNGNGKGNDNVGSDNSAKLTKIKESKDRMDKAADDLENAKKKAQFKEKYGKDLDEARSKPVCGTETTAGADVTTTTEGGGVGGAGASTVVDNSTTTVYANNDGTTTTIEAVTTTDVGPTETTEAPTTTAGATTTTAAELIDPVPPADELTCTAPVIEQGYSLTVQAGATLTLSHAPCLDTRAAPAINNLPAGSVTSIAVDPTVSWNVVIPEPGTYVARAFFYNPATDEAVSGYSDVTIVVTPKEGPCAGKKPRLESGGMNADGHLVNFSPDCADAQYIRILWQLDDGSCNAVTVGYTHNGFPVSTILKLFGLNPDIQRITGIAQHMINNEPVGDVTVLVLDPLAPPGDIATTTTEAAGGDVTTSTTGAPTTTAAAATTTTENSASTTVSGGTTPGATTTTVSPENNSVVKALPVEILTEEPSPGVPGSVIAVHDNTAGLTCDKDCVSAASGIAKGDISLVEISINGSDWTAADSGFVAPVTPGGTTVRLRVTPKSGGAKILSTRFVRDRIDLVHEQIAQSQPDSLAVGDGTGSGGTRSSFPWWIVAVVIAVILLFVVVRRRKDDDEQTQQA